MRTRIEGGCIRFLSHEEQGWIDRAAGQGRLVMRPGGNPENFLRVLYAWLALTHSGLLLHACGVIRDGKGYVFCGYSGAGKSTVARLSRAYTILSDDLVIVRRAQGRFYVYGVPFRGGMAEAPRTNTCAPLHGLFTLHKAAAHAVAPLTCAEAVARVATCVPFVMAQPSTAARVMAICANLAVCVAVRGLHFRPDEGFWEVIHD